MKKHWLLNSGHTLLRETRPPLSTVSTHNLTSENWPGKNLMKINFSFTWLLFIPEKIKFEHKKLAGISARKGFQPSSFWQVCPAPISWLVLHTENFSGWNQWKEHPISWLTLHAAKRSDLPDDLSRLAARENGLPLLIRICFGKTEALKKGF